MVRCRLDLLRESAADEQAGSPIRFARGSSMGRGRQKAKHTKLARELKSFSPNVNYSVLQQELGGTSEEDAELVDKWADYADYEADQDDDGDDYADDRQEGRSA